MLILQNISYIHPNGDLLFDNISLAISKHDKISLTGNNGAGKSTLLRLISEKLRPSKGKVLSEIKPYYVPQIFGQYDHLTIAQALQVDEKLNALKEILSGNATEEYLDALSDDWTIEETVAGSLQHWGLTHMEPDQLLGELSGGQKTRVFLAGISIHSKGLVLLDEPTNHLDLSARELLYEYIETTSDTLVIVSHDRKLLNLTGTICELSPRGLTVYGGNYDFYREQKEIAVSALSDDVKSKEKALRKAKEKERDTLERQQRSDTRGKKKQEKAGVARIMMNTLRNNAENSTSKLKGKHAEITGDILHELQELRKELPDIDKMKFTFGDSALHKGKVLFSALDVNFAYDNRSLWAEDLDFQMMSGDRIAFKGANGSGKTSLIKLILREITSVTGTIQNAIENAVYIDQDYSLIDNRLTIYEQAQKFNTSLLQEHEVRTRLNHFLFSKEDRRKSCSILSGGERMRLALCCLTMSDKSPDIIILDEPTNNLDIQNVEILAAVIGSYSGTLIVVSHDEQFLKELRVEWEIILG